MATFLFSIYDLSHRKFNIARETQEFNVRLTFMTDPHKVKPASDGSGPVLFLFLD
jgi:hypothetical protein